VINGCRETNNTTCLDAGRVIIFYRKDHAPYDIKKRETNIRRFPSLKKKTSEGCPEITPNKNKREAPILLALL